MIRNVRRASSCPPSTCSPLAGSRHRRRPRWLHCTLPDCRYALLISTSLWLVNRQEDDWRRDGHFDFWISNETSGKKLFPEDLVRNSTQWIRSNTILDKYTNTVEAVVKTCLLITQMRNKIMQSSSPRVAHLYSLHRSVDRPHCRDGLRSSTFLVREHFSLRICVSLSLSLFGAAREREVQEVNWLHPASVSESPFIETSYRASDWMQRDTNDHDLPRIFAFSGIRYMQ